MHWNWNGIVLHCNIMACDSSEFLSSPLSHYFQNYLHTIRNTLGTTERSLPFNCHHTISYPAKTAPQPQHPISWIATAMDAFIHPPVNHNTTNCKSANMYQFAPRFRGLHPHHWILAAPLRLCAHFEMQTKWLFIHPAHPGTHIKKHTQILDTSITANKRWLGD